MPYWKIHYTVGMRSASVRLLLAVATLSRHAAALSVATASPTDASTLNVPKPWMPAVVAASNAAAQRCLSENGLLCVRGALSKPTAEAALQHVNSVLAEALRDDDPTKHFCPVIYGTGDSSGGTQRHDLMLDPTHPPVRRAFGEILECLYPTLCSLGEDAELHELGALISDEGAPKQYAPRTSFSPLSRSLLSCSLSLSHAIIFLPLQVLAFRHAAQWARRAVRADRIRCTAGRGRLHGANHVHPRLAPSDGA